MRTEPVKDWPTPCLDGCEPLRVMVMVGASALAATAGVSEPEAALARFAWVHADASRASDMTVAASRFISVLPHWCCQGTGNDVICAARIVRDALATTFPSMLLLISWLLLAIDGRSAAGQLLEVFGIPSPLHGDLRGGVLDLTEIVGCKFDCYRSDVLFEARQLRPLPELRKSSRSCLQVDCSHRWFPYSFAGEELLL
jgi:hypothetical protein